MEWHQFHVKSNKIHQFFLIQTTKLSLITRWPEKLLLNQNFNIFLTSFFNFISELHWNFLHLIFSEKSILSSKIIERSDNAFGFCMFLMLKTSIKPLILAFYWIVERRKFFLNVTDIKSYYWSKLIGYLWFWFSISCYYKLFKFI